MILYPALEKEHLLEIQVAPSFKFFRKLPKTLFSQAIGTGGPQTPFSFVDLICLGILVFQSIIFSVCWFFSCKPPRIIWELGSL